MNVRCVNVLIVKDDCVMAPAAPANTAIGAPSDYERFIDMVRSVKAAWINRGSVSKPDSRR